MSALLGTAAPSRAAASPSCVLTPAHAALFSRPRRLLLQLEATRSSKGAPGGRTTGGAPPESSLVTYELHSRPEQDKFSQAAKVSVLSEDQAWGRVLLGRP